tara:strand:+ start:11326 stop:11736 length:411 start_codon:yes stop_codon:yes gene_type:complete
MRARAKDTFEDATLNLAPMIDVVFLLLVFFMVATTFASTEEEIPLDLPSAETGEVAAEDEEEIIISLDQDGGITMGGRSYTEDTLIDALESAAATNPDVPVTIRGDRDAVLAGVVGIMDVCRTVGLTDLGIATEDH